MKTVMILLFICCQLMAVCAWAQDEKATEPAKDAESEQAEVAVDLALAKPIRLASDLPRAQIPANEDAAMRLLANQLPKDALLWLETEDERFLSLWQKDRSGYPKGAVLIAHAEGEHPAWPSTTKPLHDTLPDYGWATLAISLPPPDQPPLPTRTLPVKTLPPPPSETSEEEKEEAAAENTEQQTQNKKPEPKPQPMPPTSTPVAKPSAESITEKRLESALKFLHDRGQFNIILLGSGSGAIRAQSFLEKIMPQVTNPKLKAKLEKPVRAMVIVNGRNTLPTMTDTYDNWFSDPDVPILDIFVQSDDRNRAAANHRKTLSKQKKVKVYKQVRLTALNPESSWGENGLSRRVRSFLDNNAVGIEVKNARLRRN